MEDLPGNSLIFEGAAYDQDEDDQEEEANRRNEIQNRIDGGELDGILGDEDYNYSDEDEASEEEEQNMSVASSARRNSIQRRHRPPPDAEDHFAQTPNMGRMPAGFAPHYSADFGNKFSTPAGNMNPPLQIPGTVIQPLENGRQYQPNLPAIADQTLEQISGGDEYGDAPIDGQFKTPRNSVQPVHQFALPHSKLHSLERFAMPQSKIESEVGDPGEVSIDLEELDREQAKKLTLREGEAGWAVKYEELFKAHNRLEILYKIRGSKLEETVNSAAVMQEESTRQMRAMNHRLNLADKQCEDLRKQIEELNEKHKDDEKRVQEAEKRQCDIQAANGELVRKNTALEAKLNELEQDVENLNFQITEQQKNDTIETITKRYEMAIEQMRDQHSKDAQTYQETLNQCQMEMDGQAQSIISLSEQLKTSIKSAEELSSIRERLEYENGQLKMKISADHQQIEQLTMRCQELEQNVENLKKWSELSKQPNQQSDATTIGTLSKELERAIEGLAKKRAECTSIRAQLDHASKRVAELEQLKEQLEKEKQELADELKDTKTWLDRQLAEQEKHQSSQANLQNMDMIVEENERNLQALKNQIKDLNFELEALRAFKVNKEAADNQLFMQINDLNLRITAQQTENEKIKAMYLDVCNEKANAEAEIRAQYDKEYEKILIERLESKLAEEKQALALATSKHKTELVEEYKRKTEASLNELTTLKKRLVEAEEAAEVAKQAKTEMEAQLAQESADLNEKLQAQEKTLRETKKAQEAELKRLDDELTAIKATIEPLRTQKKELEAKLNGLEAEKGRMNADLEAEKTSLQKAADEANRSKEELAKQNAELIKRLQEVEESTHSKISAKDAEIGAQVERCLESERSLAQIKAKLQESEARMTSLATQLDAARQEAEHMKSQYEAEFAGLVEKFQSELVLSTRLADENKSLREQYERLKQDQARVLEDKDKECEKVCSQLQQRYQNDYDKFMRDHKSIVQKIIQEKRAENEAEVEALIKKHEQKLEERDQEEQRLQRQLKELRDQMKVSAMVATTPRSAPKPMVSDVKIQTERLAVVETSTSFNADYTDPVAEEELLVLAEKDDIIRQLETRLHESEQLIQKTDSHFNQEIEKMMRIEEAKRAELQSEIESLRLHLAQVKERLNASSCATTDIETDLDDMPERPQSADRDKYVKLRRRLNQKDADMTTIEQAYRHKIEGIESKYGDLLEQSRRGVEAKEAELKKARDEVARLRTELSKQREATEYLRKSLADSDRVIDSLKAEMKKNKESFLDEMTELKMKEEFEKKKLKMRCLELEKDIEALNDDMAKVEERARAEMEDTRNKMQESHDEEMAKMQLRLKDLVRSTMGESTAAKTAYSQAYIDSLVEFKQNHLEILNEWKNSLLKQMDIHSDSVSKSAAKYLDDSHNNVRDKFNSWLLPKAKALLITLGAPESTVSRLATLLEKELESALKPLPIPDDLQAKSEFVESPWHAGFPAENNNKFAKRSMSVLTDSKSFGNTTKSKSDLISSIAAIKASINSKENTLYSRSAVNMRELEPISSSSASSTGSLDDKEKNTAVDESKLNSASATPFSQYKYTPIRQSMSQLADKTPSGSSKAAVGEIDYISSSDYTSPYLQRKLSRERSLSRPATAAEPRDDKDYVYIDDPDDGRTIFANSKYRGQNIRHKKSMKNVVQSRPHSANFLLNNYAFSRNDESEVDLAETKEEKASKSIGQPTGAIDALYKMSQNYKTQDQLLEQERPTTSNVLLSRSSTTLAVNRVFLNEETPIRLNTNEYAVETTSGTNTSSSSRTSSSNSMNKIITQKKTSSSNLKMPPVVSAVGTAPAFSTSSLPRSNSVFLHETNSHSYRNETASSIQKKQTAETDGVVGFCAQTAANALRSSSAASLSTTPSSISFIPNHYHHQNSSQGSSNRQLPATASTSKNFMKNSQLTKKKPFVA